MTFTLAGKTKLGNSWTIAEGKRGMELVLIAGNTPLTEYLSNRLVKEIAADTAGAELFLSTYCSLLEQASGFKVSLGEFPKFRSIPESVLEAANSEATAFLGLMLLKASLTHPTEALPTVRRVAHIAALSGDNKVSMSSVPSMGKVTGLSLDVHLDFLDFLLNAEENEAYEPFTAENSGRVFPVNKGANRTWGSDKEISYRTLWTVVHRFLQLARRSQKLKKLLYKLPHKQLVNALDYDVPGTLLVTDTVELIESLKAVEKQPAKTNSYGYSYEINNRFGQAIVTELERLDKLATFRDLLAKPIVTDDHSPHVFYSHAFQVLGVAATVDLLSTLAYETDGVSQRAFMALVRRGGFAPDEHASWVATVLA